MGDGTLENRNTPVQVGPGFKRISAGVAYNLALTSDYSLYVWGDNNYYQLGDGTRTDRATPVQ